MYQKYSTDCIVVGSREYGESDRTVALYTRDFGLIWARASAARTDRSKMRYALIHYGMARVSLVRGARGWRVAGAIALQKLGGTIEQQRVFARAVALLMRLVIGEERDEYVCDTLFEAHRSLSCSADDPILVELITVSRILYALGYLSPEAVGTTLFTHTILAEHVFCEARIAQPMLLDSINRALAETHL